MGSDIHLFVEYHTGDKTFESLTEGEFNLPRCYGFFNAISGVRAAYKKKPLFYPKGLPEDVTKQAYSSYMCWIEKPPPHYDFGIKKICTLEEAIRYSEYEEEELRSNIENGKLMKMPFPEYHSASWLTYEDLTAALEHYDIEISEYPAEYQVIVNMVGTLNKASKESSARIVFWFDS